MPFPENSGTFSEEGVIIKLLLDEFKEKVTMESIAKQSHRVGLWSPVAGILVVALASVSLLLGGLAQAQTSSHFSYPENGTGSITTLSASDPERVGTTVWDLLTDGLSVSKTSTATAMTTLGRPTSSIMELSRSPTPACSASSSSPNFEDPGDEAASADPGSGSTSADGR